ncbi:N-ethylammeline chlorohydrolase [Candidatus Altiarchaeales archaeon WOR_SM1_SCG]|nr:N-ethylammeline chlorohydrolase [Candidatus Altiarchaeales archaeon WOR_SM1_SCG]
MEILIKNCIFKGKEQSILIENNKIKGIGKIKGEHDYVIDAKNKAVMAGIVNTHTHLAMTLLRGIADDLPLDEWLNNHIWPYEREHLNPEFCHVGSLLGCLEMLKSGTTCFFDLYFFEESTFKAVEKSGMRGFLSQGILDFPTPEYEAGEAIRTAKKFIEKFKGKNERIKPALGPHAPHTCSSETLIAVRNLANKHNLKINIHISETRDEVKRIIEKTGMRPVEYLNEIGFLGDDVTAAHCVWLNDNEIKILKEKGVCVSHNQVSNMKLASGIAPITKMIDAGVNITLGTDGCASNNNLDMFEEMKTAALLHKVSNLDPTKMPAKKVVEMATTNAYQALDLNCGIEEGKLADLILIDLKKPHLTPMYNFNSHVVYSAKGSDVDTVIVGGEILMENREVKTLDEEEILEKAKEIVK